MVAGDVVNSASRLQAARRTNGVLVNETTFRAARTRSPTRVFRGSCRRGKLSPSGLCGRRSSRSRSSVLISRASHAARRAGARARASPVDPTQRVWEERSTQLVTLVGVPGIGKSRLVGELARIVDAESEPTRWRQGRCLPYGEHVTYWALGEASRKEAGILETDDFAEAKAKLLRSGLIRRRTRGDDAPWLDNELLRLVGLSGEAAQVLFRSRDRGLAAVPGPWRGGAPVLVFEDLHWADDGLLDFLDELVEWLRERAAARRGHDAARAPRAEARPGAEARRTRRRSRSSHSARRRRRCRSRLCSTGPCSSTEEQQALLERVGGNPLFAEQYVRMLAERGTPGGAARVRAGGDRCAAGHAAGEGEGASCRRRRFTGRTSRPERCGRHQAGTRRGGERTLRALERKDFVKRERHLDGRRRPPSTPSSTCSCATSHTVRSLGVSGARASARGAMDRRARTSRRERRADRAPLLLRARALTRNRSPGRSELVDRTRVTLRAAAERASALSALRFRRGGLHRSHRARPRSPRRSCAGRASSSC